MICKYFLRVGGFFPLWWCLLKCKILNFLWNETSLYFFPIFYFWYYIFNSLLSNWRSQRSLKVLYFLITLLADEVSLPASFFFLSDCFFWSFLYFFVFLCHLVSSKRILELESIFIIILENVLFMLILSKEVTWQIEGRTSYQIHRSSFKSSSRRLTKMWNNGTFFNSFGK